MDDAIAACPETLWEVELWDDRDWRPAASQFWYKAFHCLFWLDRYLFGAAEGFVPEQPFTLSELDPEGAYPDRPYTKQELRGYLASCRAKCHAAVMGLDAERAGRVCSFPWGEVPNAELLLYNMRHAQEHAAQLYLALGQQASRKARWVPVARALDDA